MSTQAQLKEQEKITGNGPHDDIHETHEKFLILKLVTEHATDAHALTFLKTTSPYLSQTIAGEYNAHLKVGADLAGSLAPADRETLFADLRRSPFGKVLKPEIQKIEGLVAAK